MEEREIDLLDSTPYVRHADLVDNSKHGYFVPWRILYDFEIMFVLDGEIVVKEKEQEYTLRKYDLHIMPPNIWHKRYLKKDTYCRYYNIHFEFIGKNDVALPRINVRETYITPILDNVEVCEVDNRLYERSYCVLKGIEFPRRFRIRNTQSVISCFDTIVDVFGKMSVFNEYQLRGMFSYLLGVLLEEIQEGDLSCPIDMVIEKFKNACTVQHTKIDMKQFAEQYGYSYVYFRNKFKERVGVAPNTYAQNERFSMAIEYLKSGYYNVSEIANMVGFENVYHFSSMFKKKFGKSPNYFLNRSKNKNNKM